ncbi:MAG: hypothetical protein M0P69_20085 [Bacteroidales bacterium]|nr:hypothetical protein [Bacteroidales bacterium]
MATIAELMRARNHIAVWEQEHGKEATPDDLMVILYNQKVEDAREKVQSKKKRKQKQPQRKQYLTKRDRELIIVMAACTQGLQNIIDEWQEHNQPPFLLRCIRTANTWIYKAMEWMAKDMPDREKMSLFRDSAYYEVGIIEYSVRRKAG